MGKYNYTVIALDVFGSSAKLILVVASIYFTGYISAFSSNQNYEVGENANWPLPRYWW